MRWGSQKEALHESVHRSSLPLKAIADRVGLKASTLSHMANEADDDEYPFRRLPSLIASIDNFALLDYYESIARRVAVALPVLDGPATEAQQELLLAAEAVGDTVRVDRAARADRRVTKAEHAQCVRAAKRVMEAAQRYIASLEDEVEPG